MEDIIQKIEGHARYGPALRQALESGGTLVLNYHSHGPVGPEGYCVSICERRQGDSPRQLMGLEVGLEELVHIRGFGRSQDDCLPQCAALGDLLARHYQLDQPPEIFFQGKPYPTVN
ncbi:MAG: hypothetical protein DWQ01_06790 [Planctomycetota bacterium]|nr:MAG: hypothetical protein DWQ01_06790 [Planctomycetota bacterium]